MMLAALDQKTATAESLARVHAELEMAVEKAQVDLFARRLIFSN
jgi:hypothetical protein